MFFDQADITTDVYEDPNGYRTQLQATGDATGTFCPNSGAATISMTARIRVTKYAGISISTTPCFITLNSGTNAFTLTTGTSGSLSGSSFKSADPSLIAEVTLDANIGGATCPGAAKTALTNYYGLGSSPKGRVWLSGASVSPTNLTGNGC
jgi:hypothetical protein